MRNLLLSIFLIGGALFPAHSSAAPARLLRQAASDFDVYSNNPSTAQQQWMQAHFWRLEGYTPYFDNRTSWFPNSWFYSDSYAIYTSSPIAAQHPEWILRDQSGNKMYIPWGCGGGVCPQYAGDITNAAFRAWWISQAQQTLTHGYKGIWIDDVNLEFRIGNGNGTELPPIDPNTHALMTADAWRGYMAQYMAQIRASLPGVELVHNSIWYAAPNRTADSNVQREIAAADFINLERGINDDGLTGGTGMWSLSAVFGFVDTVHAAGKAVVLMDTTPLSDTTNLQYGMGGYYLITNGQDAITTAGNPNQWWAGYDVDLGSPLAGRTTWNGLWRRDFAGGMVLLNEPGAPTITVTLPTPLKNLNGTTVTTVTLSAHQAAILTGTSVVVTPPSTPVASPPAAAPVTVPTNPTVAQVTSTANLSDMAWASATNGYGPVERNTSNGEAAGGDGYPLRLNGKVYAKGLGAHAPSSIHYSLGRACSAFGALVGLDDEVVSSGHGSVVFQVWADGTKRYESPKMVPGSKAVQINLNISGTTDLLLVVTDAGDGNGWDHADWVNAQVTCVH